MNKKERIQVKPITFKHRTLTYRAEDIYSKFGMNFSITISNHSKTRITQRGIKIDKLALALQYGEVFMKQGMIYYVLGDRNIPEVYKTQTSQLKNIVVVCNGQTDEVITCYRCSDPFRHIKLKSKRLYKIVA